MYCRFCGNKLSKDAKFCQECGKEVVENSEIKAREKTENSYNNKSKIAAGLLGIFLGFLGVHNFYLGYNEKAVAQLLLTILTCGLLSFISGIWGLIEGILILTGGITEDAYGEKLID